MGLGLFLIIGIGHPVLVAIDKKNTFTTVFTYKGLSIAKAGVEFTTTITAALVTGKTDGC